MARTYIGEKTKMRYAIPNTLASDYTEFLNNDIPNTVMDFELLTDWYEQFVEGYEKSYIRGVIYPDSTKSRYSNTDNNLNFRADVNSGIKKGDMIIDPLGTIYLFDWEVILQSNNAPTRALRCNTKLTFTRFKDAEVDEDGYEIEPEGNQVIVEELPCNAYRYDGRPEYSSLAGTPGVAPNALTIVTMQYNDKTKVIDIDDQFAWGNSIYFVVDINYVGLNVKGTSGTIVIQAKKVAGGET